LIDTGSPFGSLSRMAVNPYPDNLCYPARPGPRLLMGYIG
jgi:hypothetical protein